MTRDDGPVLGFDLNVVMLWLHDRDATGTGEREAEAAALTELLSRASQVLIVPTIARELEATGTAPEVLTAIPSIVLVDAEQENLGGCAKGRAERYVDLYPDARDCRAVAEAECAHAGIFVTLNGPLIAALGGRTDRIEIALPTTALNTVPPVAAANENPQM